MKSFSRNSSKLISYLVFVNLVVVGIVGGRQRLSVDHLRHSVAPFVALNLVAADATCKEKIELK